MKWKKSTTFKPSWYDHLQTLMAEKKMIAIGVSFSKSEVRRR